MPSLPFELLDLLPKPESEWLDWKADFPPGLLGGKRHPSWDDGRAKVLRALQAIANSVTDQRGYIVYGVDDSQRPRGLTGISRSFDDAEFQDWCHAAIRPQMEFHYREELYETKRFGIFEIRPSSGYPYVCEQSIGATLTEGQVWIRRGTRCTVAHHEELRRMFENPEPIVVGAFDGPIVQEIRAASELQGWEPHWPSRDDVADKVALGHRLAFLPGSRRHIHCANHVLMLRPTVPR